MRNLLLAVLLGLEVVAPSQVNDDSYSGFFKSCAMKGCYLVLPGDDEKVASTYLGKLTNNLYDADSVANVNGKHGSKLQANSIWNKYGVFGGRTSAKSPWNKYGTKGIEILYKQGEQVYIVGYLTANKYLVGKQSVPKVDPKYLAYWLDRAGEIP